MSIAFDNSYGGTAYAGESVSRSFTIGSGSDRYLIAFLYACAASEANCDYSSVQYDGVAMTYLADIWDTASSEYCKISVYYMLESDLPSGGAHNFTCSANGSMWTGGLHLISLSGVDQDAPEATDENTDTTNRTSWSNSITTLTDDALVIDAITIWNGNAADMAADSGQTERSSPIAMYAQYGAALSTELQPSAGSETQGWTWVWNSYINLHYLLSLAPSGAGTPSADNAAIMGAHF